MEEGVIWSRKVRTEVSVAELSIKNLSALGKRVALRFGSVEKEKRSAPILTHYF